MDGMDLADDAQRARWRLQLGSPFRDRPVVTGLLPLAAFTSWIDLLEEVGARRPLIIATGRGAGAGPTGAQAEIVLIDAGRYASMTEELRDSDRLARELPEQARAALEAYDPTGEAVWLLGPFVNDDPVLGRPVFGGRPASWLALEDKLLAEGVWRSVDAPHAPAHVVAVDAADVGGPRCRLRRARPRPWRRLGRRRPRRFQRRRRLHPLGGDRR